MTTVLIFSDLWSSRELERRLKPFRCVTFPLIETRPCSLRVPSRLYDWTLVTSQRTWVALRRRPRTKAWLFIGPSSSQRVKEPAQTLTRHQNQRGVLKFFRRFKTPQRIFYPRSSEGDRELVRKLREMGHFVTVRHAYVTKRRKISPVKFQRFLDRVQPEAVLFLSPSAVRVFRSLGGRFGARPVPFAWGPITGRAIRCKDLKVLKKPDLRSFHRALLEAVPKDC